MGKISNGASMNNSVVSSINQVSSKDLAEYAATEMMEQLVEDYSAQKVADGTFGASLLKQDIFTMYEDSKHIGAQYDAALDALNRYQQEGELPEEFFDEYMQLTAEYVVEGARLTCDMAQMEPLKVTLSTGEEEFIGLKTPEENVLKVVKGDTFLPIDKKCAVITDAIKYINIKPFRNCKNSHFYAKEVEENKVLCHSYGTCYILMKLNEEWTNAVDGGTFGAAPAELKTGINMLSHLLCQRGGIIVPMDSGQEDFVAGWEAPTNQHYLDMLLKLVGIQSVNNASFNQIIQDFAAAYKKNITTYQNIAVSANVPPELIAFLHYRENSTDFLNGTFNVYLHNGQALGQTTTIVPVGKYFTNFSDAAIDAINDQSTYIQMYNIDPNCDVAALLCMAERFNGMGYYNRGVDNPYLFSGTNKYSKGKYAQDGVYDPNLIDQQVGVYLLLNEIMD